MRASSRWKCCAAPTTLRCASRCASSYLHARAAFGFHELSVDVLQVFARWAALAVADRASVDFLDRRQARKSAGDEGFVGAVHVGQAEVLFEHGNRVVAAQAHHVGARDATEAVLAGG